jgi:hypothetical protein
MKSWKTTLFGILAVVPQLIDTFITSLPAKWAPILSTVSAAIAFYFAKDKDTTGKQ